MLGHIPRLIYVGQRSVLLIGLDYHAADLRLEFNHCLTLTPYGEGAITWVFIPAHFQ